MTKMGANKSKSDFVEGKSADKSSPNYKKSQEKNAKREAKGAKLDPAPKNTYSAGSGSGAGQKKEQK